MVLSGGLVKFGAEKSPWQADTKTVAKNWGIEENTIDTAPCLSIFLPITFKRSLSVMI